MATHIETSLKGVAQFFGVAYDTVKTWRRNGMPGKNKAWDLGAIYRWLQDRKDRNTEDQVAATKRELEVRRLQAQIQKVDRENDREEGKLIDRTQVDVEIGILLSEIRTAMERLPKRMQPALPQEHAEVISAELARVIYQLLNEVADRMKRASAVGCQIADELARKKRKK